MRDLAPQPKVTSLLTSLAQEAAGRGFLAFEPPDRVVVSWDISDYWQLETDAEHTSEVEIRFIAEAPQRTRLELEHRHIDRHRPGWEGVRAGVDDDAGWTLYLSRYAGLLGSES